jgi:hypothetical protein
MEAACACGPPLRDVFPRTLGTNCIQRLSTRGSAELFLFDAFAHGRPRRFGASQALIDACARFLLGGSFSRSKGSLGKVAKCLLEKSVVPGTFRTKTVRNVCRCYGVGTLSWSPGVRVLGSRAAHWTLPVGLVGPGPEDPPALHVARGLGRWGLLPGAASGLLVGGGWRGVCLGPGSRPRLKLPPAPV